MSLIETDGIEAILRRVINKIKNNISVHTEITYTIQKRKIDIYMINEVGGRGVTGFELRYAMDYLDKAGLHVYWVEPSGDKLRLQVM